MNILSIIRSLRIWKNKMKHIPAPVFSGLENYQLSRDAFGL